MAIHIPVWLLWTLGIGGVVLVLVILFLAYLGIMFVASMWNWRMF